MYTLYAIASTTRKYVYVGITKDLSDRLNRHNKGYERTTRPYKPFQLIYREHATDRQSAREREKYFKSRSGKRKLYRLIVENYAELKPYRR